ncbi:MAG: cell division inhibitor [Desulfuromonas sp.]|uniref:SRPBCC family protein n=1 Tax=Desulfuromonas sp. TaxID=892 RepID=UPI000CAAC26A|nr:SRPBCC family protein [Desulfuromonas sp.]PLX82799.1 MAG: cell division inhibitor [Desulfuromonas sp.]
MKLYRLHYRQKLPVSLEEAWRFFSDPANLASITPPGLGFVVTSPPQSAMYPGMIISYRIRPLVNIPLAWVTEITHVRQPTYFVDEQRAGPYRFWQHQHHFRAIPGGVEMEDLVHYALPLGLLGNFLQRVAVGRQLEEIFSFRRHTLESLFPVQ